MKVYDLKPLLETIKNVCEQLRALFIRKIHTSRHLEDGFAFTTYKTANDAFVVAMQQEISLREMWYRQKVWQPPVLCYAGSFKALVH